jgi:hypothetical protein
MQSNYSLTQTNSYVQELERTSDAFNGADTTRKHVPRGESIPSHGCPQTQSLHGSTSHEVQRSYVVIPSASSGLALDLDKPEGQEIRVQASNSALTGKSLPADGYSSEDSEMVNRGC